MTHPLDSSKADVLAQVCAALSSDNQALAGEILRTKYPFVGTSKASRRYTERQSLRVFYRDGFIDRYSGIQLVHPGALRLLSVVLPDEFPAHRNGDTSKSHFAGWELFPSIDHLVPVARGGADDETNWVTTSMLRNSAKSLWTLQELGWALVPAGDMTAWDGLTRWYVDYLTLHPELLIEQQYLRRWFTATLAIDAELN